MRMRGLEMHSPIISFKIILDGVATTHLYPAETLTWMKQKGLLTIPCVAIATDYACIPFWEETNCDDYVIPHKDLIPEFASYGIPKEKLLPLGIPGPARIFAPGVERRCAPPSRSSRGCSAVSRHEWQYGIRQGALLAHELVSRLKSGEQVVIICGNNKKRARSLRLQFHEKFKCPRRRLYASCRGIYGCR